jgi:hypothetical protein
MLRESSITGIETQTISAARHCASARSGRNIGAGFEPALASTAWASAKIDFLLARARRKLDLECYRLTT